MKAMIHTKLGVIKPHLDKAIMHHMQAMTYSCIQSTEGGLFNKKIIRIPIEDTSEYWSIMRAFYPWNEIAHFYGSSCVFCPDADISISVNLAGAMFIKESK